MSFVRIKLCGFTRADDIRVAVESGADALGLVFYPPSKRNVSIEQAVELAREVPPFVSLVGLFVDADSEFVDSVLKQVPLSLLQFHGNESAEFCESFNRPYIKAVRFETGSGDEARESNLQLFESAVREHQKARGILVDAYHPELAGGSGEAFNWSALENKSGPPIILAGGLSVQNVATAIETVKPCAVDVSSGIESEPGIKSAKLMTDFIRAARN